MQNYMRTILSALQTWIDKRLKETVPETDTAHQQFVTDVDGNAVWEEKLAWKEVTTEEVANLEATELMAEDEDGDGAVDSFYLLSPWLVDPVAGNTYKINYNGTGYDCYAIDYFALDSNVPTGSILFGNLDAIGMTGIAGSNTDAPFVFMSVSNATAADIGGVYGMFMPIEAATTATISVSGVVATTAVKPLDPDFFPDSVKPVKQIILTIDSNGNITSDTDFNTAWAMTPAQLQSAITINRANTYMYNTLSQCPILVSKFENTETGSLQTIHIQHQSYIYDSSDVIPSSQTLITWGSQGIYKDERYIPGFFSTGFFSGDRKYPVLNGGGFIGHSAEDLKRDLGLAFSSDNAGQLLNVGTDGFATPIQLGDKLEVVDGVVNAKEQQCQLDWNNGAHILNRTHFEETGCGTYTIDKDFYAEKVANNEYVALSESANAMIVKISDVVPSIDSLERAEMGWTSIANENPGELVERGVTNVVDGDYVYGVSFKLGGSGTNLQLYGISTIGNKAVLLGGSGDTEISVTSTGLYMYYDLLIANGINTYTLKNENYLKQLDEKYIPDTIARTADFTDALSAALAALGLPTPTADDAGKILRVNSEGKYELVEQ